MMTKTIFFFRFPIRNKVKCGSECDGGKKPESKLRKMKTEFVELL